MAELPLLSASSVNTFLRCGQQWFFAYVAAIKSPPTLKQARGLAVHKAIEVNFTQKISSRSDLPLTDVADAYSDEFDALSGDIEEERHQIGDYKDSGIKLVKLHTSKVAPEIQPIWVEQPVQFMINGIPFSGQVDVLDEESRIRDTKTTARKPSPDSYLLNMTGYAISYRQITGAVETDTVLDYLVATQRPYYLPITMGGPVGDEEIVRFADIVENVAHTIKAGRFVPNGLITGACSWCGYRDICPAYKKRNTSEVDFDPFGLA
jgi:RecB family exonuclease